MSAFVYKCVCVCVCAMLSPVVPVFVGLLGEYVTTDAFSASEREMQAQISGRKRVTKICMCLCMCLCVCAAEREREKYISRHAETHTHCSACVCLWVHFAGKD